MLVIPNETIFQTLKQKNKKQKKQKKQKKALQLLARKESKVRKKHIKLLLHFKN